MIDGRSHHELRHFTLFFLLSIEAFVELEQRYFLGSLGFIFD